MKAVTWQGTEQLSVEEVPDPKIQEPTDAIIKITSTAICGSDLHLYKILGMFLDEGDIIGHEPMGIVEEVGSEVTHIAPGDRVVVAFNISCGSCFMCDRDLFAQCETTQVTEQGKGASLFGYTRLYGSVPGAQAEYLRVPQAHFGPIKVSDEHPDERFLFMSDVIPTAWQSVHWADIPEGGTLAVYGLGPIGQLATRIAKHKGARVIGVDLVRERLAMAERHGIETLDASSIDDVPAAIRDMTAGRGPDSVIDAVGMESHGSPVASASQKIVGMLPEKLAAPLTERFAVDRLSSLHAAIDTVRRGGTVSVIGVYGGMVDPMPMMDMFDKGIQMRMGQAHVKKWIPEILPLLEDESDPLGAEDLTTHRMPLAEAPHAYEIFQKKQDECIKVVLKP